MGRPVDSRGALLVLMPPSCKIPFPFLFLSFPVTQDDKKANRIKKKVNRTSKHDKAKLKNRQGAAKVLQDDLSTHKIPFFIHYSLIVSEERLILAFLIFCMAESLKQKAAKGLIWKFLGQGGTQLIQFISGIYIARILSPEDYGLVGMMAIFLGISQLFIDSGFRSTLIQKGNDVTNDDYNVVFIFNLFVSIFFYLLIYFGAPLIADFYNEPRLLWVARVLGLNLIFISLGIINQTILEKKLNFRTLTKIRLTSILFSVVLGIVLAVRNYGVWSLVVMAVSENIVRTTLVWFINRWTPSWTFKIDTFKELYSNGIKLLLAGLSNNISNNLYSMIIGRYFTVQDVGFFSQGKKLQKRIGDFINSSIQGVMYPVQSLMKDDVSRLKNSVRKNVALTTLITFPASIGMIAIAFPFIQLFLTEKWLSSVYYLQVLSVAGIFFSLRSSLSSFLMPLGKFTIVLWYGIFNSIFLIFIVFIGLILNVSLKQLVLGKVIQEGVGFFVVIYFSRKYIAYRATEIIKDFSPALIFSIIMGSLVYLVNILFSVSFTTLFLQVVLGGGVYIFLNFIFNRKMFNEIVQISKDLILKRRNRIRV